MKPIKQLLAVSLSFFAALLAVPQICSADMVTPGVLGAVNSSFSAILAFIAIYLGIIAIGEYFIKKIFSLSDEKSLLFSFLFSLSTILFGYLFLYLMAFIPYSFFSFLGGTISLSIFFLLIAAAGGIPFYLLSKKFWKSFFTSAGMILSFLVFFGIVAGIPLLSEILTVSFTGLFFWKLTEILTKSLSPRIKTAVKIVAALAITGLAVLSFFYISVNSYSSKGTGGSSPAKNATIRSYMDQMRTAAVIWQTNQTPQTYIGFNANGDGLTLENKIKGMSGAENYNAVVSTDAFCAKAKYIGSGITSSTYWCIDSANGYSGTSSASECTESNPDCL
jgi:hypothetical protein